MIFPCGEIAASLHSSQRQDQLTNRCHCERSEAISSCVFTLKPGLLPTVTPVFLFNIFEPSLNSFYSCSKIRSPPAYPLWMSVARPSMAQPTLGASSAVAGSLVHSRTLGYFFTVLSLACTIKNRIFLSGRIHNEHIV